MKKIILAITLVFSAISINVNAINANINGKANIIVEKENKGKKLKHKGYGEYYYKKKKHKRVAQKAAEEHKAYIKDYVGLNLASVGYYSLGEDYMDRYGDETVKLVCVDVDGNYIDISKKKDLKKYYILAQDYAPNSELVFRYPDKEDGTPDYDGFIESQSIEQVTLYCKKMKKYNKKELIVPQEPVSPNKNQYNIRNYKGKNLATVGYLSLGGDFLDAYGSGHLKIVINTSDGSSVDISKKDQLAKYQVIDQDIPAGSTLTYVFDNDMNNFVDSQNYDQIVLTVKPIV